MPELCSEHPSREELQSYFNEHWRNTKEVIVFFRDEFGIDSEKLYARLYDSILNSLYRLNDFPREDKFWHNTNVKPTIFKLNEFCWLKLEADENDRLALWTILAGHIMDGATNQKFDWLVTRLVELNELETDFWIKIYLTRNLSFGTSGGDLPKLLIETGLQDELKPALKDLMKKENVFVSNWAQKALNRIENQ
jgi:hypothetical protein